jgi:hypothetical protein
MVLLGDVCHVDLEIMLVSAQDRCTLCAKCAIGLETALDRTDGTPR